MAVRIGVGMGLGGFPFESMREFHGWLDVCEDSKIDSIWQSDRVISREIALEPMTLLSVIAGATTRLKFGTNAIVLPFRDPITFARQCATLDHLSDGRFLPTVAIGTSKAPEWEATGRSSKGRGARADEALEVITRLWSGENADFKGEYYSLKGATINPRPKQQPLPLWLGGASAAAVTRTARFGSGWLAPLQSPSETAETVRAIRAESQRLGRPIPEDHYGASIVFRIGKPDDEKGEKEALAAPTSDRVAQVRQRVRSIQAIGDAGVVLERLQEFRAAGVTKFIAIPLARNAEEMSEQCRLLDREVIPHANA
jgi:probable F420-dependent oxidoreductase